MTEQLFVVIILGLFFFFFWVVLKAIQVQFCLNVRLPCDVLDFLLSYSHLPKFGNRLEYLGFRRMWLYSVNMETGETGISTLSFLYRSCWTLDPSSWVWNWCCAGWWSKAREIYCCFLTMLCGIGLHLKSREWYYLKARTLSKARFCLIFLVLKSLYSLEFNRTSSLSKHYSWWLKAQFFCPVLCN